MAGAAAGEIRIGGNEAIIAALLPQALGRLRAQYPNVSVSVRHVVSVPQQYRELRERRLDVILGRVTLPADEDTEADVLYREPTHVVAGVNSRWARRRARFAFSELADEPWALPLPNTLVGALFSDAFSAQGLNYPPRGAVLGSIHLHCALVASGQYLAVMPASVVRRNGTLFGLRTLPVDSPVPASPVGVLALRRRDLLPVVRDFIASIRESVADLHSEP
jgi:DNA-binding transcriptional LysR family regulator